MKNPMSFKNNKPKIEFISRVPELLQIEECLPKPAKNFLPAWWKNIPVPENLRQATVRECPGIADWFSQGYIIPMWMDISLFYNKEEDRWGVLHSDKLEPWDIHKDNQFIDHVEPSMYGSKASLVFKSHSPWLIKTSPGYSVYQMPLFYNFNNNFSVLPGVVDTDIHHEMNQQVLYHGDQKEIFIKRGDPFVLYVPFKRTKYDLSVRAANQEDIEDYNLKLFNYSTKSIGQREYRKLQRERDNKNK